jgi:SAM-dependent methyltransferase
MAAVAVTPRAAKPSSQQPATAAPELRFAARVMEDCSAALRCALCDIGDRVGLFKAMANSGPVTAAELARETALNARLLRDWLNAMAAASYIEYRPVDKTYRLPKEHAVVLADEEKSPLFMGGLFQMFGGMVTAAPKVANAFQTGKPVPPSEFPAGIFAGVDRGGAPQFRHELVQHWIPLLPDVRENLLAGASAADVGCGTGLASVVLAKAFPKSQFAGYDPYAPSIRKARDRAKREGLSDRVHFFAADNSKLPRRHFDLVTIFRAVHHFSDPVVELRHCREALRHGGTCFVYDGDLSLNPEDNMNAVGRMAYASSTLFCVHSSMENNGAALGAEFNEQVLKDIARKSGFRECKKLSRTPAGAAFYQLRV